MNKIIDEVLEAPLVLAIINKNFQLANLLLDKGASIDVKLKDGNTLWSYAIEQNDLELLKSLFNLGADITQKSNGLTAINLAAKYSSIEIVKFLISEGVSLNMEDDYNQVPLNYAVEANNLDLTKFLVENGANVNGGANAVAKNTVPSIKLIKSNTGRGEDILEYLLQKGGRLYWNPQSKYIKTLNKAQISE